MSENAKYITLTEENFDAVLASKIHHIDRRKL